MLARDQYGQTLTIPGKHPRKELLDYMGRKTAKPIYLDKKDGRTVCVGYYICGIWWTLYERVERKV